MTREEAIKYLKSADTTVGKKIKTRTAEALDMAIKALEQEPCDDAISRQAVLAIAEDSCLDLDSYEDTKEFCDEIKELPSVTPQPCEDAISRQTALSMQYRIDDSAALSTRDWARVGARVDLVECTSCGYRVDVESYTYPTGKCCPNCGATMRKEKTDVQ